MVGFICYFFPAVVALWIYEWLTKENLSIKKCIFHFCTNTIVTNFACICAKKFITKTANSPFGQYGGDFLPEMAFQYLLVAVATAVAWAVLEAVVSKKLKIVIEDVENEEKEN